MADDKAGEAYKDMVRRFLGEDVEMRFVEEEAQGFFERFFRKAA